MEKREPNILDYFDLVNRKRGFIVSFTFFCTVAAIVISLVIPKTFKAQVTLMPIGGQKGGGISSAVAQIGLGGLLGSLGGNSSNVAQIMAILKSRTLSEKIIERNNLLPLLFPRRWNDAEGKWKKEAPSMEDAVRALGEVVDFFEDKKSQTVSISAEFKLPEVAAKVANDYVQMLSEDIDKNTFTSAKRNRIFIEGQLERNKAELLSAGKEIDSFYSANKISNAMPMVDVDVSISSAAASADGQTDNDPNSVEALQKKLEAVNRKLDSVKVVQEVPQQVYLQYLTLRQELLGKVNALLTQQYELAKVEENKDDLTFQVIDWARVPVKRFKPKRGEMVISAFVLSLLASVFIVFFREYIQKLKESGSRV